MAYLGAPTCMAGGLAQSSGDLIATLTGGQFVTIDATAKDGDGRTEHVAEALQYRLVD